MTPGSGSPFEIVNLTTGPRQDEDGRDRGLDRYAIVRVSSSPPVSQSVFCVQLCGKYEVV
jgi:hypothetical protein